MTQTTAASGTTSLPVPAGPSEPQRLDPVPSGRRPAGRHAPRGRSGAGPSAVRPAAILAIVLVGQFMAVLDASVVNVAAPSIHAALHASGAALQLVIAGYTITYAVLLVSGAHLGDLLGHRRIFLTGLALFTVPSLGYGLAGATPHPSSLRLFQGSERACR